MPRFGQLGLATLLLCLAGGAARAQPAVDCHLAFTPQQAQRLFADLEAGVPGEPCRLESLNTERSRIDLQWLRDGGEPIDARLEFRSCTSSEGRSLGAYLLIGGDLLTEHCPGTLAALDAALRSEERTTPASQTGGHADAPLYGIALGVFALLLLSLASLAPRLREAGLGAALDVALWAGALALRLWVSPAPANWYDEVLPPNGGPPSTRFGPGAFVFHAFLRTVQPWSDQLLFTANAALGALAVPMFRRVVSHLSAPIHVGLAVSVLFALAPLHVRVSASSSAHVLSSTLTVLALLAWLAGQRPRDPRLLLLAMLAMLAAALTRIDAWVQVGVIPLWALLTTTDGKWRENLRPAAIYAAIWAVAGLALYLVVVRPSGHPPPTPAEMLAVLDESVRQYPIEAFTWPHWIPPIAVWLAIPGLLFLLVTQRRLLALIVGTLLVCFVPTGRDFVHTGLLGARYFLFTLPVFFLLAAFGLHACVAGLRRWPKAQRIATAALLAGLLVLTWLPARGAYAYRYAFQDEYDFLRRALTQLPEGCAVYQLPIRTPAFERDLDCCLDLPRSPLTLVRPDLSLRTLPYEPVRDDQIRIDADAPACRYYYDGAACQLRRSEALDPRDEAAFSWYEQWCRAALEDRRLVPSIAEGTVSHHAINPFFRADEPVRVQLYRLR